MDKLEKLAEIEGFEDSFEMLEAYHIDSVVPGICSNPDCDYTCDTEPDQTKGWCEECNKGTVVSCMILAGIM